MFLWFDFSISKTVPESQTIEQETLRKHQAFEFSFILKLLIQIRSTSKRL